MVVLYCCSGSLSFQSVLLIQLQKLLSLTRLRLGGVRENGLSVVGKCSSVLRMCDSDGESENESEEKMASQDAESESDV